MQSTPDDNDPLTDFLSELRNTAISVKQQSNNSLRNLSEVAGISAKQIHIDMLDTIRLTQDDVAFLGGNGLDLRSVNFRGLIPPRGSWLKSADFFNLCNEYFLSTSPRLQDVYGPPEDPHRRHRVRIFKDRSQFSNIRSRILQTVPNESNARFVPYQTVSRGGLGEPLVVAAVDSLAESGFDLVIEDGGVSKVIHFPWNNLLAAYCDGVLSVFGDSFGYCASLDFWVRQWGGKQFVAPKDPQKQMRLDYPHPLDVFMISSSIVIILTLNGTLIAFNVTSGDMVTRFANDLVEGHYSSNPNALLRLQRMSSHFFGVLDTFGAIQIYTRRLEFVSGMLCTDGGFRMEKGSVFSLYTGDGSFRRLIGRDIELPSLDKYEELVPRTGLQQKGRSSLMLDVD